VLLNQITGRRNTHQTERQQQGKVLVKRPEKNFNQFEQKQLVQAAESTDKEQRRLFACGAKIRNRAHRLGGWHFELVEDQATDQIDQGQGQQRCPDAPPAQQPIFHHQHADAGTDVVERVNSAKGTPFLVFLLRRPKIM